MFQLGMSVADAARVDPTVKSSNYSVAPNPSDPDASLVDKLGENFAVSMSFKRGRLVYILGEIGNISPDDAKLFNRNTLNQLGPPSANVYQGSDMQTLVWIDGDIRLKYDNRPYGASHHGVGGPRIVSLTMCVYPQMHEKDPLIARSWGDTAGPFIRKQLPDGIGGLRLLMAPWQVRRAVPGIEISSEPGKRAGGEFASGNYRVTVEFWEGHLKSFCEYWSNEQFQHYSSIRTNSLRLWGTPASGFSIAILENSIWDDGKTKIDYDWTRGTEGAGALFSRCFTDLELAQRSDADELLRFEPAPVTKSFF